LGFFRLPIDNKPSNRVSSFQILITYLDDWNFSHGDIRLPLIKL
jgi:hypothetical protein